MRGLEFRRSYIRAAYRASGQTSFETTEITRPPEDPCDVSTSRVVNRTPDTSLIPGKEKGGPSVQTETVSLSQGE